jgi:hypothetical protein
VAKKAVKDEDEEEERDALRKKTIDERDSLRTVTRAETHGHDPSESRISGSKQSAIGGGRATRAGLDDDWDVRRSRQAAAQEARRNTKVRVVFSGMVGTKPLHWHLHSVGYVRSNSGCHC